MNAKSMNRFLGMKEWWHTSATMSMKVWASPPWRRPTASVAFLLEKIDSTNEARECLTRVGELRPLVIHVNVRMLPEIFESKILTWSTSRLMGCGVER